MAQVAPAMVRLANRAERQPSSPKNLTYHCRDIDEGGKDRKRSPEKDRITTMTMGATKAAHSTPAMPLTIVSARMAAYPIIFCRLENR